MMKTQILRFAAYLIALGADAVKASVWQSQDWSVATLFYLGAFTGTKKIMWKLIATLFVPTAWCRPSVLPFRSLSTVLGLSFRTVAFSDHPLSPFAQRWLWLLLVTIL